jgi:hypothetical protein
MHFGHTDAQSWRLAAYVCAILCVTLAALLWEIANVPTSTLRVTSVASAEPLPNEWLQAGRHVTHWHWPSRGVPTWLGDAIHDGH